MSQPRIVSRDEWLAARKQSPEQGEGIHAPARSPERRAARTALGQGRQALCLRRADRARRRSPTSSTDAASWSSITSCSAQAGSRVVRAARWAADQHRRQRRAPERPRRDACWWFRGRRCRRSKPSRSAWAGASSGCRRTATTSTTTITCRSRRRRWRRATSTTTTARTGSRARRPPASACSPRTRPATSSTPIPATRAGATPLLGGYYFLDLVPKGRDEETPWTMAWVRHHDRYGRREDAT